MILLFSFSTLSSASTPSQFFFIKKSEKKLKMDFFFSAKQWRIKKVKGRMRRSMVAMGGHLGNKKKISYTFFSGKRSEENNNFWTKAWQKKISLLLLFPPGSPPSFYFIFSSFISIHSFFICRNESNLSMKNKFYIKGSQFFFILNSHSIFLFFGLKSPPKKISSFFIFFLIFFPSRSLTNETRLMRLDVVG
ncbi:hypothetical protein ACKWTF_006844 [Chironomus riparius]